MTEYLIPIYLAAASRFHGHKTPWFNPPLRKFCKGAVYALPYAALPFFLDSEISVWYLSCMAVASLVAVALAKNAGHMDGFYGRRDIRDNKISPAAIWIYSVVFGRPVLRDSVKYDTIFLTLKGGLIGCLGTIVIAVLTLDGKAAWLFYMAHIVGFPLGYYAAWRTRYYRPSWLPKGWLPRAEVLSGLFCGLGFLAQ